jgi:hypothetical protein
MISLKSTTVAFCKKCDRHTVWDRMENSKYCPLICSECGIKRFSKNQVVRGDRKEIKELFRELNKPVVYSLVSDRPLKFKYGGKK